MKINEDNASFWEAGGSIEFEIWKLNGEESFFEVPVEIVRDFANAIETRDSKADELYWLVIEALKWSSDYDIRRIKTKLQKLDDRTKQAVGDFADYLCGELREKYKDDWMGRPGINVSDDGWCDLRAEVVSKGKEFYEQITVPKLRQMIENNNYRENFLYVFQD